MMLIRDNFKFKRIFKPQDIIKTSSLFYMEESDIKNDNIKDESLEDGKAILVYQNTVNQYLDERYCYVIIHTLLAGDNHTKKIIIDKILIDESIIDTCIFEEIFKILMRQENNEYSNRIVLSNIYDESFKGQIDKCATELASRVYNLYYNFTSDSCPVYYGK